MATNFKYLTVVIILFALLLVLAYPLQKLVVWLRVFGFLKINCQKSILVPNNTIDNEDFIKIYQSKCAHQRSKGAQLPNLFWYFLSPGAHMHQETMEEGPVYDTVSELTRKILNRSAKEFTQRIEQSANDYFLQISFKGYNEIKLRDFVMPIWVDFFFKLLFNKKPSIDEHRLILANANDFIETTKCCKLPNLKIRKQLVNIVKAKLANLEIQLPDNEFITEEDWAYYIRGIYLTTAITQLSEATAHVLLSLAKHVEYQNSTRAGNKNILKNIVLETLRIYPLFGIALRIVTDDISLKNATLKKGKPVCFHYSKFQIQDTSFKEFNLDHWRDKKINKRYYIPFGMKGNHSCSANGLAHIVVPALVKLIVDRYYIYSSIPHFRSLVSRGPALIIPTTEKKPDSMVFKLIKLNLKHRASLFFISFKQLLFGVIIFIDASRKKYAEKYYAK